MAEIIVKGMKITLSGPEFFKLSQIHPDSLGYDLGAKLYSVTFTNVSDEIKKLPFDEISRTCGFVFRNTANNAESSHLHPPPPKDDGAVDDFLPGSSKTFNLTFEYPEPIVTMEDDRATLQFCLKWEDSWLRASAYKPDAFNWNESFELCQNVIISQEH